MVLQIPGVVYALVSAFSWALSTMVVNRGLTRLDRTDNRYDIVLGLATSLLTGCFLLSMFVLPRFDLRAITVTVVLAGIFTFPIGTGLYYFTAEMYLQKAEIAAQFVQVKPIFSVVFALVLGEQLGQLTTIGLGVILLGLALLLFATIWGEFSRLAAIVGLTTAFSWALGEGLMKISVADSSSVVATYVALLTGTVLFLLITVPVMYGEVDPRAAYRAGWLLPFAGHGILSMGLAYTTFFTSIKLIGLAQTALITAFWPILAVGLGVVIGQVRGDDARPDVDIWYFLPASVLLVLGSALAAV
jgi:DME family drug/metabolite transporter